MAGAARSLTGSGRAAGIALPLLPLAVLLVVVDRPVAVDDPLFLVSAAQILRDPLRPFHALVNWYGNGPRYLWVIAKNPPGLAYWLAAVEALVGPREVLLHLSLLPFALAAALAGIRLARRFARGSPWATACWTASPAFLVSASTLMADVPALALSLWAVVLFVDGVDRDRPASRRLAGLLAGVAVIVKYTTLLTLPVLALYLAAMPSRGRSWRRALDLWPALVPAVAWSVLGLATYGRVHFVDALTVVGGPLAPRPGWFLNRGIALLAFIGASGVFPVLFVVPALATLSGRLLVVVGIALGAGAGVAARTVWPRRPALLAAAVAVAGASGAAALLVAGWSALRAARDDQRRELAFLAGWAAIEAAFAWFWAWTVAARFVLPLLPPLALLLARALPALREPPAARRASRLLAATTLASLVVSVVVLRADAAPGEFHRATLAALAAEAKAEGRRAYYVGAWGFAYYAERAGMERLDLVRPASHAGDLILQPYFAANNELPKQLNGLRELRADIAGPVPPFGVHTMNAVVGAGFYSSIFGPLPFAVGRRPAEGVRVWRQTRDP